MKNLIFSSLLVGFFALPGVASAEAVKQALPACTSDEYLSAITDGNSLRQLMVAGKCTILKVGSEVVVVKRGFMTSVILYQGNKLYTASEAIR